MSELKAWMSCTEHTQGFIEILNHLYIFKNVYFSIFFLWSKQCNDMKKILNSQNLFGGSQEDIHTYSGAKKYLVSHQLCKFSHLKI